MRNKSVCFTGHRKIPCEQYESIAERLEKELIHLIEQGYLFFGAGGALGFDTVAALSVLHLKEQYPEIKLILVFPCKMQTKSWDKEDIAIYEDIKQRCDKCVYTSQEYTRGCMFKRNRHLVDNSSVCIAYLTENSGGTAYTVDYAKKQGVTVINVATHL